MWRKAASAAAFHLFPLCVRHYFTLTRPFIFIHSPPTTIAPSSSLSALECWIVNEHHRQQQRQRARARERRDETFASQSRRASEHNFFPPLSAPHLYSLFFSSPAKFNFSPARKTIFRKISFFASMIAGATWNFRFFRCSLTLSGAKDSHRKLQRKWKETAAALHKKKRKKNVLRGWHSAAKTLPMSEWKVLFAFIFHPSLAGMLIMINIFSTLLLSLCCIIVRLNVFTVWHEVKFYKRFSSCYWHICTYIESRSVSDSAGG